MSKRRSPAPPNLGSDAITLAVIAGRHCWMPNPDVVAACGTAVFPSIRARSKQPRLSVDTIDGKRLMYDDNMTPRWAFLWAHGIAETGHPKGWTFAHVWTCARDPDAYTHLANLALLPEPLASLSDKVGPFGAFLRYHAQCEYGWRPKGQPLIEEPEGYNEVDWTYLPPYPDPRDFISGRLQTLKNERVLLLRQLIRENGAAR